MKLINSSVEIIPQEVGLTGIYKQIEKCGRTCYKSTDKITEDSAKPFVDRMIQSNHTAMLEQSAVYLKIPIDDYNRIVDDHDFGFWRNPYSYFNSVSYVHYMCISTNLRVLYEYHYMELLDFVVDPTEQEFKDKVFERRVTVKFICDRGVSHELVRHRVLSFAQESTRYCNYNKDKFGNELTFIIPTWLQLNTGHYEFVNNENGTPAIAGDGFIKDVSYIQDPSKFDKEVEFLALLCNAENTYMSLINGGCKPQEARQVLPNALKTEVCVTGFVEDWKKFFELRFFGYTGKPHPDMQKLATELFFKMVHIMGYTGLELDEMVKRGFSDAAAAVCNE